jgi:outer membrane protein assembly factor BamA
VFLSLLLVSCSNTKYLPKGEKLYTGAKLKLVTDSAHISHKEKKALKEDLEDNLRPKPNAKALGLRYKLWFYNIAGKPTSKGLRYFVKNKLGEPPVLWSSVDPEKNRGILKNRLENRGFFTPEVYYIPKESKNNKMRLEYTVKISSPYTIASINFPKKDRIISQAVRATKEGTLLKVGDHYNLDVLKKERERIDSVLKDEGYFYFSPDYILFRVDSNLGNHKVNIYVRFKHEAPRKAFRPYMMNSIYVYPNYSIARDSMRRKPDTTYIDEYIYIGSTKKYKPRNIVDNIFFEKGYLYSNRDYDLTLNRLMNMGTFKFVNVKFSEPDSAENNRSDTGLLNAYVYLTSLPKRTLRAELQLISKSNDYAGPALTIGYRNRNYLKGAELLTINLNASVETLISGPQKGLNSWVLGAETGLQIPRFITPFYVPPPSNRFVPKTIFKLAFQKLSRVQYYNLNSFNLSAGYRWNETERKTHELNPISIDYLQLGNESDQFRKLIKDNYAIQRSFESQFILGTNYSYTYSTLTKGTHKNDFYFNGTADVSGNAMHALQTLFKDARSTHDTPYTVLGRPYSQYSKVSFDVRHYLNFGANAKLATRLFAGFGIPYGNSFIMPYTKQFFSGGNNSIRAFQARSLGPGTYHSPDAENAAFLVDEAGDIKLEGNIEYRFGIIGIFKGAVFTDAGNIWLYNGDPDRPGGRFHLNTFPDELGVGSGVGLRIDASIFVLRFDLAFPLRKPWLDEGHRWVIDKIQPLNHDWIGNNLVLNIAIGYPF